VAVLRHGRGVHTKGKSEQQIVCFQGVFQSKPESLPRCKKSGLMRVSLAVLSLLRLQHANACGDTLEQWLSQGRPCRPIG
jgi:hypothetical protein